MVCMWRLNLCNVMHEVVVVVASVDLCQDWIGSWTWRIHMDKVVNENSRFISFQIGRGVDSRRWGQSILSSFPENFESGWQDVREITLEFYLFHIVSLEFSLNQVLNFQKLSLLCFCLSDRNLLLRLRLRLRLGLLLLLDSSGFSLLHWIFGRHILQRGCWENSFFVSI